PCSCHSFFCHYFCLNLRSFVKLKKVLIVLSQAFYLFEKLAALDILSAMQAGSLRYINFVAILFQASTVLN
ncbi:MAG: hypothetical protein ACRENG_28825, partial [bacterium]